MSKSFKKYLIIYKYLYLYGEGWSAWREASNVLSGKRRPSSWTHTWSLVNVDPVIPQCQRHSLALMSIFLVANHCQPCIQHAPNNSETFQADHAEHLGVMEGGERGGGGVRRLCDTSVCVNRMQVGLVLISCAHSVPFKFLWLTYGLFTCCQPSCPIKARVLRMSTTLMWSLLDWMKWCRN